MANIEEVIKMIYRLYRKGHNQADSPCPDEETLVCFSEGRLSGGQMKSIQEHLISCPRCAEIVSLFCKRGEEAQRQVPEFLIKKAKALVEGGPPPHILEVILALKERALQILGTTGDIILGNEIIPQAVFRSREISELLEEIKLLKEFKDIKITLYIQKRGKDKIRLNLNLVDKVSLQPISDLRLVLLEGTQEIESYAAVAGNAAFDNLGPGRYTIQILRRAEDLGAIELELK
jgi:hypothetical protein